jgi:hypothetical protein
MKRQLTRKLSTAEFAHSHSGPRPTSDPAPISLQRCKQLANAVCTSLRPGPFTYTHAYHLSVLGVCRAPPPRLSSLRPAPRCRSRARQRGMGRGRRRRGVAGATAEGGGGEARENFQDGHPLWPPAHLPGSGGVSSDRRLGNREFILTGIVPVSSLESSRPPRSPSGCGGSSSAWRV